jgi:hypothetical protein
LKSNDGKYYAVTKDGAMLINDFMLVHAPEDLTPTRGST